MTPALLRVLVVDDEPLARKGIRKLLSKELDIQDITECDNGIQAVERIRSDRPDVVFLDIQMPGLDGFGVFEAIGVARMPVTVFVTAYDLHAMRAFDVHAIDYLLKPITSDRMAIALDRARGMLNKSHSEQATGNLLSLLRTLKPPEEGLERIIIRSVGKVTVVPVREVEWIEAEGDYVKLHTLQKSHLLRERISVLEAKLDPAKFIRIHRSTIVRIQRIRELRPVFNGDHVVILQDGRQLSLSRKFRDHVFAKLKV